MRELHEQPSSQEHSRFWTMMKELVETGVSAAVVLIVDSQGDTPGRPGFRMLVTGRGRIFGTVGGGAVEADLVQGAQEVLREGGRSEIVKSDLGQCGESTSPDSAIPATDMICGGSQTTLLYPCRRADLGALMKIAEWLNRGQEGVMVWEESGLTFVPGTQHGIDPDSSGPLFRTDPVWSFRDPIAPADTVHIIGGGHVSLALSRVLATLPLRIVVLDDRPDLETMAANEYAHQRITAPFDQAARHVPEGDRTYVVIMTPSHRADDVVLRQFMGRKQRYLGMMGSPHKVEQIFSALRREGVKEELLDQVHAPIGVPIPSHTPEEIAVSIAAEIIAVRNGRT